MKKPLNIFRKLFLDKTVPNYVTYLLFFLGLILAPLLNSLISNFDHYDVKATIKNFKFGDINFNDSEFYSEILFANNGNKTCSIEDIKVEVRFPNAENTYGKIGLIPAGCIAIALRDEFPVRVIASSINFDRFILKPGDIKVINLLIGKKFSSNYYKEECSKFGVAELNIVILYADPSGRLYSKPIHIASRSISETQWKNIPSSVPLLPTEEKESIYQILH